LKSRLSYYVFPKNMHIRQPPLPTKKLHPPHGSYCQMKVTKKSSAGNRRRRKGNGQVRPPAQQQAKKEGFEGLVGASRRKPYEPIQPSFPPGLKTHPDGQERLRKLWEHKQGELETRWATAQAHQAAQDTRRKRRIKIGCSIAGAVLIVLLCTVAWFAG
jgi:hypothetical protein